MKKFIPTEEQLDRIKDLAKQGETLSAISLYLDKDRCCIKRLLKEYNIVLTPSNKNKAGKKYIWNAYKLRQLKEMYLSEDFSLEDISIFFETSEKTVFIKAKELGIKKVQKKFFSNEEIEYLKFNAGKKTLKEMSEYLNKNDWVIGKKLTKLGISIRLGKKILMPETEEFEKDISNPQLSNTDIARKYNVSSGLVGKWRKQRFGNFKTMINTWLHKSSAEVEFESILEEIDISAEYQKKIGNWKVDYYLGSKIIVEIQGSYWHDKLEKVIKKDIRKFNDLESMGYITVAILDKELEDRESVKERVLSAFFGAVLARSLRKG